MWIVFLVFSLGALCSTVSSSPPSPIDVTISSVNLRNLLRWSPGNGTPNDTHYTVQYAIYGDSVEGSRGKRVHWRSVRHCTEVVRCWCDLSNEMWDLEHGYYARVRAVSKKASSKWASTRRRFDPKSDITVDTEDNSAIITIKGPMRYQPNNQTTAVSMATLYDQMTYNISVHNTRTGLMSHFQVASSLYKYRLMEYDTKYCFSARTKFLSMPVHCQPSEWHCITTPPDPLIAQLQWLVVGIAVPFAFMSALVVIGCLLYQYLTGKGQKSPYTLNPPSFHSPPLIFPLETPSIVLIEVGLPLEEVNIAPDPAGPKKQQHILEPPPRYAPHRSETPLEPVEPCDDEPLDYAFVCKASGTHTGADSEERERSYDGGEDGRNEKPEWRVANGHFAGAYTPQEKSHLSQKSTSTCSEAVLSILTQKEVSTHVQAHTFLPVNSALLYQSQAPSFILQEGEEDKEVSGLFADKNPQTSLFSLPFNVGTNEGIVEEMGSGSERAPLLSAYASQIVTTMPTSQSNQSNYLSDDYGVMSLAQAHSIEEDEEKEEEEEGSLCINWDPMTKKLMLPQMGMELMQGERGRESETGGEEGVHVTKGGLRLENVFVRQGSEEKAEALREMEGREETRWEADSLLSKWDLVISMDQ